MHLPDELLTGSLIPDFTYKEVNTYAIPLFFDSFCNIKLKS